MKKTPSRNHVDMSDRPIDKVENDRFDTNKTIVNEVCKLLDNNATPLTIAITGEWGIGKSSAINLLKDRISLNKKNIIVQFDPISEGKVDVIGMIELFHLKLYTQLTDGKSKKIFKKSLKTLAILLRCKASIKAGVPSVGEVVLEYDVGDNFDKICETWKKEAPKIFSEQTNELNKLIKKHEHRLYVIIDGVDGLSAKHILNLLYFSIILDGFDGLVCIFGLDYKQALNKLIKEPGLSFCDYNHAKDRLDKFFQHKFVMHIPEDRKVGFAVDGLKALDSEGCFDDIFGSQEYDVRNKFKKIIGYLATPRAIKKWLLSIKINYFIINFSPNKSDFLAFIATLVNHPILRENISKYTLNFLYNREIGCLTKCIKEGYGINFYRKIPNDALEDTLVLISTGITNFKIKDEETFNRLSENIIEFPIEDPLAESFLKDFLSRVPVYFLLLFIEGYTEIEELSALHDFMEGDINAVLKRLLENGNKQKHTHFLTRYLFNSLKQSRLPPKNKPSIDILNEIFSKNPCFDNGNPYLKIILYTICCLPIEEIIYGAHISLSGHFMHTILTCFEKKDNNLAIDKFIQSKYSSKFKYLPPIYFKGKSMDENPKEVIKEIIVAWLDKVQGVLANIDDPIFQQTELDFVVVFSRFIRYGKLIGERNQEKLTKIASNFLKDKTTNKVFFLKEMNAIREKCYQDSDPDPMEMWFGPDKKSIIELIDELCKEKVN